MVETAVIHKQNDKAEAEMEKGGRNQGPTAKAISLHQ